MSKIYYCVCCICKTKFIDRIKTELECPECKNLKKHNVNLNECLKKYIKKDK